MRVPSLLKNLLGRVRRPWLWIVVFVVAVIVAGGYFYGVGTTSQGRLRTAKVERGPLVSVVSTTGTLNAVVTVQVGTQVSGQVRELMADFNSKVTKGQVIARIDPQAFEAKVSQVRAEVEGAEANVLTQRGQVERTRADLAGSQAQLMNQRAQIERSRADVDNARAALSSARAQTAKARVALQEAKRDLERKNDLYGKELISRSERDTAQAAYDSALAQVEASQAQEQALASAIRSAEAQVESNRAQEQAFISNVRSAEAQLQVSGGQLQAADAAVRQKRAVLQQAQVDLEHTVIRSPVDGVVVSRSVDVGQTVAASLSAPTLFTIAQDLNQMQVDTNVDEADIGRIEEGQKATFTVDSLRGQVFNGRVREVRKAARVVQNVVTYNVVIAVENPGRKLIPGLTATARIVVATRNDVLKIPNAALRFRPAPEDGTAPGGNTAAAPAAKPDGRPSTAAAQDIGAQIARELQLTSEQQVQLGPILEERRLQQLAMLKLPQHQRRAATQQMQDEARTKISRLLTPEQLKVLEKLPGWQPAGEAAPGGRAGTVWVLGERGNMRPVEVRVGISDGSHTEVLRGELDPGLEVIVGAESSGPAPPAPSSRPTQQQPRLRL